MRLDGPGQEAESDGAVRRQCSPSHCYLSHCLSHHLVAKQDPGPRRRQERHSDEAVSAFAVVVRMGLISGRRPDVAFSQLIHGLVSDPGGPRGQIGVFKRGCRFARLIPPQGRLVSAWARACL